MSDWGYRKAPWYEYRDCIKYISMPNELTYIGIYAFQELDSVSRVTIPASVTTIGQAAFYFCNGIDTVEFTDGLQVIDDHAFFNCKGLTNIVLPNTVTEIGLEAFSQCSNIKSVTLSNNLQKIGTQAFAGNLAMETISVIPASVTSIGEGPFVACWKLSAINVDGDNENYSSADGILFTKDNTTLIQFPCNKKDIIAYTIPSCVTTVGPGAFNNCQLEYITLPNTVTNIGDGAFFCFLIKKPVYNNHFFARLPNNYYGSYTIPDGIQTIVGDAFIYNEGITKVTIPNTVTSIGDDAFYDCKNLRSIVLPESLTFIDRYAFSGCIRLKEINIPKNVEKIKACAFRNCDSLISVTWDAVNCHMEDYAPEIPFVNDSNIISFTLGRAVEVIPSMLCYGLKSITSISIPRKVESIGNKAFYGCTGLTSITCEAVTPPALGSDVFYEVNKNIPLYVPAGSVEKYKDADQWKDFGDNIKPIQAEQVEVVQPNAEPTTNSVVIEWPKKDEAVSYTIIIKKGTETICTLTFNAEGQLTGIQFAPSRNGKPKQAPMATLTATGWQYTVSGLEPDTDYSYTVIGKRSDDSVVLNETILFTTKDTATGIDQGPSDQRQTTNKIIRNGQILILRGDKTYTVQGQEVR